MRNGTKILLKCRPTASQLADRTAEPVPDGLELYLATEDLEDDLDGLSSRINLAIPDSNFPIIVEGPLRSLDGSFFDLTNNTGANQEVLDRLVTLGQRLGSPVAVIHAIAVRDNISELTTLEPNAILSAALPLLRHYTAICSEAGIIPTIENVPPVCMMREGSPLFSALGVSPEDLVWLCDSVPGLRVTLDISHAQLYINAVAGASPRLEHLATISSIWRLRRQLADWSGYVDALEGLICNAHLSNARGIVGEGLSCYDGDLDLAVVGRKLAESCQYLVTETIEPDADHAVRMREVQQCLIQALAA
jgi:sugar phosphate isomerase/epimerase